MRNLATSLLLCSIVILTACSQTAPTGSESAPNGGTDWWADAIETLKQEQRKDYERDKAKGEDTSWLLTTPSPPASPEQVAATETRLGLTFDSQYKQWLAHANGWKFFLGVHSLYSLDRISPDSPDKDELLIWLANAEVTPSELGINSFDELIVIGGYDSGPYVIATVGSRDDPNRPAAPVFEFGGGVEKHKSFQDFISAGIAVAKDRVNNPPEWDN